VKEFKLRIPRAEAIEIRDKVISVIMAIGGNHYTAEACGSFRRGKSDCGDIDVLITRKDGKPTHGFLKAVVDELSKDLITDSLVDPKLSSIGTESYMGIGQLRPDLPHRRIDLKLYPRDQFGFAVLYFTGSDNFNRAMRLYASKLGYQLSDHGLYSIEKNHKKKIVSAKGASICCYKEEDVFAFLGINYVAPKDRSS
jgi:DNA polymerase lambda